MRIPGPSTNDSGSIPAIRKRGYSSILNAVLHAIVHFGTLGVVEAIDGTDEVTRDAADTFESNTFTILVQFFFGHCCFLLISLVISG